MNELEQRILDLEKTVQELRTMIMLLQQDTLMLKAKDKPYGPTYFDYNNVNPYYPAVGKTSALNIEFCQK